MNIEGYDKLTDAITGESKKDALKLFDSLDRKTLIRHIENINLEQCAKVMQGLKLDDAAEKLKGTTKEELLDKIAQNPKIIEDLKRFFD